MNARLPLAVLVFLGLLSGNCQTTPLDFVSVPPGDDGLLAPGTYALQLGAAGNDWTYLLHVSAPTAGGQLAPLLILLHGSGEDGKTSLVNNGWIEKSESAGFVIAAPSGLPLEPDQKPNFITNPRFWNAEQPYLTARRRAVDDLAFFDALLMDIQTRANIDPDRIFLAGHSGGGGMVFRLAAERAEQFAAVAVLSSPCFQVDPAPSRAVPMLFIVGTLDPILPLDGGSQNLFWLQRNSPPVLDIVGKWATALGCTHPSERQEGALKILDFGGCSDGATFRTILIEGHGHRWPGGETPFFPDLLIGPTTSELNATDTIWEFFEEVSRG
ncbi:MAG: alpha/beta hydrolase [Planctomycetota bacterium]|nr:alpha/beta hydrolase [Planctomycetota bacterium]